MSLAIFEITQTLNLSVHFQWVVQLNHYQLPFYVSSCPSRSPLIDIFRHQNLFLTNSTASSIAVTAITFSYNLASYWYLGSAFVITSLSGFQSINQLLPTSATPINYGLTIFLSALPAPAINECLPVLHPLKFVYGIMLNCSLSLISLMHSQQIVDSLTNLVSFC